MAPPPKSKAEIDRRNRHASYMRGWRDGAKGVAMRTEFTGHENHGIRHAYSVGYDAGVGAYAKAAVDAARMFELDTRLDVLR